MESCALYRGQAADDVFAGRTGWLNYSIITAKRLLISKPKLCSGVCHQRPYSLLSTCQIAHRMPINRIQRITLILTPSASIASSSLRAVDAVGLEGVDYIRDLIASARNGIQRWSYVLIVANRSRGGALAALESSNYTRPKLPTARVCGQSRPYPAWVVLSDGLAIPRIQAPNATTSSSASFSICGNTFPRRSALLRIPSQAVLLK